MTAVYMGSALHMPDKNDIFCLMVPLTMDLVSLMDNLGRAFRDARKSYPLTESMSWDMSHLVDFHRVHVMNMGRLSDDMAKTLFSSLAASGVAVMAPDRATIEAISGNDPFTGYPISRMMLEISVRGSGEQANIHVIRGDRNLQSVIYPLAENRVDERSGLPGFTVSRLAASLKKHAPKDVAVIN